MAALFYIALAIAILDWLAVFKGWKKVEYFAKPATMIVLLAWLFSVTQFKGVVIWFAIGLILSLLGDVFLMLPGNFFLPGLVAFLLAHIFYIAGFIQPVPDYFKWEFAAFLVLIALAARQVYYRLSVGLVDHNRKLKLPVLVYLVVISIMLLVASSTLVRLEWAFSASLLAAFGALSFYISDAILAWMKFVAPIKNGRVMNMAAYHLGQFAIAAAAFLQFGS